MTFEEAWDEFLLKIGLSESDAHAAFLAARKPSFTAGWKAAVADREERIRVLTVERDNQYEENISLIVTLADLEERIRQRDGEWVDAIEDTLHFGIVPETLAGAIECMKAWLEEREERIRVLEASIKDMLIARESAEKYLFDLHVTYAEVLRISRDQQARIERVKVLAGKMKSRWLVREGEAILAALDGETK